ncbi:MAG: GNAT family N-acetyltransferase [Chloroflexota bacterium]|nr:MAG: GNAT family N-acetyltransferase [Chloroflexota bacterium]
MLDVVARAELANQEIYRSTTIRSGGVVTDQDGLCIFHGLSPSWVIANGAFRTDPAVAAGEAIERTVASFRDRGRRPALMTLERHDADLDRALASAGWTLAIALPVMVCGGRLAELQPGPGVVADWLDQANAAHLERLRDVLRRGFAEDGEEREVVDSIFATGGPITGPDAAAALVRVDGRPAATAIVYQLDGVAVVAWVATVPEARRQGLGRLVTTLVTNRGFDMGADTASLQASPMGAPLYRTMGYETVTNSRIWIGPLEPDGAA